MANVLKEGGIILAPVNGLRMSPHVYNTPEHVERAVEDTDLAGRSGSWRNPFATMRGLLFPPPRASFDLGALHGIDR